VTSGGDKIIRLWDLEDKKSISYKNPFDNEVRALDWNKDGSLIVAGDNKSHIILLDGKNLEEKDKKATKLTTLTA